ncbi:MAG TPA: hypothetical protein HA227_04620 [Candidatus Diapherotrites archaeon]|uniref:Transposase n=1 Tax=Candidatus Iainarchaeum sp. TaxID=3101447 RepID=A0A7J4KYH7_9ARCH|nr:hypothetical protein [Candidatus Diapherotrites archaeon]
MKKRRLVRTKARIDGELETVYIKGLDKHFEGYKGKREKDDFGMMVAFCPKKEMLYQCTFSHRESKTGKPVYNLAESRPLIKIPWKPNIAERIRQKEQNYLQRLRARKATGSIRA